MKVFYRCCIINEKPICRRRELSKIQQKAGLIQNAGRDCRTGLGSGAGPKWVTKLGLALIVIQTVNPNPANQVPPRSPAPHFVLTVQKAFCKNHPGQTHLRVRMLRCTRRVRIDDVCDDVLCYVRNLVLGLPIVCENDIAEKPGITVSVSGFFYTDIQRNCCTFIKADSN